MVSGDDCFPKLSFTAPQNNTTILLGDSLFVSAELLNEAGIVDKVGLYLNNRLISELSSPPFEWRIGNNSDDIIPVAGTNVLKLTATNSVGFTSDKNLEFYVEPPIHKIPGLIQAEHYALMKGIQTDETTDVGGGLSVSMESGEWLSFELDIDSSALYQIEYRVAAESNPVRFYTRLDGIEADQVDSPATGDLQNWKSVIQNIYLFEGRHTMKLDALKKFNINWMNISFPLSVGINTLLAKDVNVYPNPAENTLFVDINNTDTKISLLIFDCFGRLLFKKTELELKNSISLQHLSSGIYFVEITNGEQSIRTKFIKQ